MSLSQSQILEILTTGDFARLIGQFESDFLECKSQPYALDSEDRKMELAKDVSGLANGGGGILLLGLSTRKNPTHGEDQIDRDRPFPLANFNHDQYRQVLSTWLWPPLDDVEIRVAPSAADPTVGIVALVVPSASDETRPFLVAKTLLDSNRKTEIVFGYCERRRAHVAHYDVRRLHSLLRDGRLLADEIRGGFATVQHMIGQVPSPTSPPTPTPPENINPRIDEALQAVGHYDRPAFVLAAVPRRSLNLRALFESRRTPLVELLEHPPTLRQSGFGITADINSRIVEGRLRRSLIEGFTLLEVHRDGVLIFVAPGDQSRLCWGREDRQESRFLINQLALIEMVYLFSLFSQQVYEGVLQPGEIYDLEMRVLRLRQGNHNFYLEAGVLHRHGGHDEAEAHTESRQERAELRYGADTPGRAAFLLLAELYAWMEFEEERIPYAADVDGVKSIDPTQITAAGQ
ncbi:MAG: hypothetical protein K8F56_16340 [Rhodocyclaceae bacterium]|nr:hypothetical protein [Rhodocyclaceae bacterium]